MSAKDLFAKVRKIEIRTRKLVEEITGGAYHSVFKGHGIEFSDVREYTSEDDVRDIDWNVTARTGTPFIKKYVEERELTVILAVDASASLSFGTTDDTKQEKTAETAALLALSAIRNHDKVGLLVFTDRTELWLPPKSGRSHVLRLIRELLAFEPVSKKTDLSAAMDSLARNLKKRSVIFFLSDFLDSESFEKKMRILNIRHDLAAFRILDPVEMEMPELSCVELEDVETGEALSFDAANQRARSLFHDAASKRITEQNMAFSRAGVDLIDLHPGEDIVKPLMAFFHARKMRKETRHHA